MEECREVRDEDDEMVEQRGRRGKGRDKREMGGREGQGDGRE